MMNQTSQVLKELQPVLEQNRTLNLEKDLAAARKIPASQAQSSQVVITEYTIPGPESKLYVRVYRPSYQSSRKIPGLFWCHGGGYVMGYPSMDDDICGLFVTGANCAVVSVDYRLAPEHPYPAAAEDCYAGLRWMAESADKLGIQADKIAVAGPSAGGGLTAALTLMSRDRGTPNILFQMPLYPMLDDRNETPSSYEINETVMPKAWNRKNNLTAWHMYLGDRVGGEVPAYAAPARAQDLHGLPPAYVCIGQLDPFRDEALQYVSRLAQAGVPVEFHLYPGCYHGFDEPENPSRVSKRARDGYIDALKRAFEEDGKQE